MKSNRIYLCAAIFIVAITAISGCMDKAEQDATGDTKAMNVSAIAVRGGYPESNSQTYQYQIDLFVKNEGNSEIVFDTVGMYYIVGERTQPLAHLNTGPEKKWIIKPGDTENIPTDSADKVIGGVALARSRGLNNLVLGVIFYNNGRYVNGLYGTSLPLVEDLPHESEGRGILLKLDLVTPGGAISEENMTELYDALPLPNNKMGKAVESLPMRKKAESTPEIMPGPGFSEPTFAMIGFVTYQNYSIMSNGPEYSIDLLIQSATNKPVTFNKIVAKYYDQGSPKTIEDNIYPVTLEYGQAVKPNIKTSYLADMQDRVERTGKKTVVIYIQLKNGEENVGGEYSASLPPLSYMEKQGTNIHQMDFALDNMPLYKYPIQ
ncbi:MAG: hypothetical protein WA063_05820 [Minisyncoccia bacterium]